MTVFIVIASIFAALIFIGLIWSFATSTPAQRNAIQKASYEKKHPTAKINAKGEICCPFCGSTQITANKKGFGVGKAAAGAILTGNIIGASAGMIGSNKIIITCLKCGKQFSPGK